MKFLSKDPQLKIALLHTFCRGFFGFYIRNLQEALDIMGFENWEIECMFKNVAGIMHMGEMKFKQRPREEQAEPDGDFGPQINQIYCCLKVLISIN